MLYALIASLLLGTDAPSVVAARYASAIGSRTHLIAEFRMVFPDGDTAQGDFRFAQPNFQRLRIQGQGVNYEFVQNTKDIYEVLHDRKTYDYFTGYPNLMPPPMEMTGFAEFAYPTFLLPSMQNTLGQITEGWTGGEEVTVEGVATHRIEFRVVNPEGTFIREFYVGKDGLPRRYTFSGESNGQPFRFDTVITSIDTTNKPTVASFAYRPADGYNAYRLPMGLEPVYPGEGWPDAAWIDPKSMRAVQPKSLFDGQAVLLVITAPDCAVSTKAEPALKELREALATGAVRVVELSLGESKPSLEGKDAPRPVYWDRDGSFESLRPVPATPFFMLWDGDGVMRRQWMGYTTEGWRQVRQEILEASKAIKP